MIRFTVPGIPVAKGRPRLGSRGGRPCAFTPAKTVAYEGLVAMAGQQAMAGREPLSGPLSLSIIATFPIAKSWSAKKKAAARFHISRPDADNLLKAIGDGLNGVVWADDCQIARASVEKRYGDLPGVVITIGGVE